MSGIDPADVAALTEGCGWVRAPRDVLWVSGRDAASYLQGQCSQEIESGAPGSVRDSLVLSPQGRLDALVRISRLGPETFLVDVAAGFGEVVAARLARFRLRVQVEITELSWSAVALRGREAVAAGEGLAAPTAWSEALGEPPVGLLVPWAWGGTTGWDLLGSESVVGGIGLPGRRCALAAWEAVRVAAGVAVQGRELDERTIPAEAGLVARAVSMTKGCYTGQELVARLDARGSNVARRLRRLTIEAPGELAPLLEGADLHQGEAHERAVGRITSAAPSPDGAGVVALGYLHRSVVHDDGLVVVGADGEHRAHRGPDPEPGSGPSASARLLRPG
jgi:folate-binding protein YgfZ